MNIYLVDCFSHDNNISINIYLSSNKMYFKLNKTDILVL